MDVRTTTRLLQQARRGDAAAVGELFPRVYEELRRIAEACFRSQPPGHTLQPTAIVHEAYLRLVDRTSLDCEDYSHFVGLAAKVLRGVVVDHARRRSALKRGGGMQRLALEQAANLPVVKGVDMLVLDEALTRLEHIDPRKSRVVELRAFLGMTIKEVAETLSLSPKTVEKDWEGARAWLRLELEDGPG